MPERDVALGYPHHLPYHLVFEYLFPFIYSSSEMKEAVMQAIQTRNMKDLLFLVGRSPAGVPHHLIRNEKYTQAAGFSIILPCLVGLGFNLSPRIFTAAARHGNLDILMWLKQKNCPWDENTFHAAAEHGDLLNMKWLKQNGCP